MLHFQYTVGSCVVLPMDKNNFETKMSNITDHKIMRVAA